MFLGADMEERVQCIIMCAIEQLLYDTQEESQWPFIAPVKHFGPSE